MTNDGWGKEWYSPKDKITVNVDPNSKGANSQVWIDSVNKAFDKEFPVITGIDLGCIPPKTEIIIPNDKMFFMTETGLKEYSNKMPTHDPYTNPNAQIYYQCSCGAILDPGTKSFAALNNAAMNAGWKVRWGETSYKPYCVKCGEDVE